MTDASVESVDKKFLERHAKCCASLIKAVRKDERRKARQHIWVRKGVQVKDCCRAALEETRISLHGEEDE